MKTLPEKHAKEVFSALADIKEYEQEIRKLFTKHRIFEDLNPSQLPQEDLLRYQELQSQSEQKTAMISNLLYERAI